MYNLRYHIVSIVAIFLALALGLVLGGLIGDKTPSTVQTNLADTIAQKLQQTRDESARIKEQNNILTTFGNDNVSQLIKDRLATRTVLLIGDNGTASKRATELLQQAGATVVVAGLDAGRYKASDKTLESPKLVDDLKKRYEQTNDLAALAAGFAAEWSQPTPPATEQAVRPVTAALQSDGILKLSRDPAPLPVFQGVVDVALGAKDAPDAFGLQLVQAFDERNIAAIAAQMNDTTTTLGSAATELHLSATNLLGLPPGDWTVIAVLAGAPRTTYGTLDGANQHYPPIR